MNVVPITQAPLLDDLASEEAELDEDKLRAEALQVYQEAVDGHCSLQDALLAVFVAGMEKITGKARKKPKARSVPPCPYADMVALYEELLPSLPGVSAGLNPARRKVLREFWVWIFKSRKRDQTVRATTHQEGLDWIRLYLKRAADNDFIMGRTRRSAGHENWKPDVEFIYSPRGIKQVLERTVAKD